MALASTVVWDIRTTGSDTNGGGFNAARGGTDYSQQNSAQATGTVTSSGTTVTATTSIFTSQMVGNLITDGTVWKEITAFSSATVVTVDSAPTWTSASIAVGGSMATINAVNNAKVSGNLAYIQKGTYTTTVTQNWTTADATWDGSNPTCLIGYNVTHGDSPIGMSTQPVISCSTSSVDVLAVGGAGVMAFCLTVDGNNTARHGVIAGGTGRSDRGCAITYVNVKRMLGYGFDAQATLKRCRVTASAGNGHITAFLDNGSYVTECVADNNTAPGFGAGGTNGSILITRCISAWNTGSTSYDGIQTNSGLASSFVDWCISYKNGGNGFGFSSGTYNAIDSCTNNVAYGNGLWGIQGKARPQLPNVDYNAYGSNTSGNITGYAAGAHDVTLTGDPYGVAQATVAAADSVDAIFALFAPNNTAGAGAALRGAGWAPYLDIGAVQHQDAGGAAGLFYRPSLAGVG